MKEESFNVIAHAAGAVPRPRGAPPPPRPLLGKPPRPRWFIPPRFGAYPLPPYAPAFGLRGST